MHIVSMFIVSRRALINNSFGPTVNCSDECSQTDSRTPSDVEFASHLSPFDPGRG